jgi:hypothetical protein
MSHSLPLPLPLFDRALLHAIQPLVPSNERDEWLRSWQAELWHMHHGKPTRRLGALRLNLDLPIGLVLDALWLRTDSWRLAFSGTSTLCIASLLGLCFLSTLFALVLYGGWHSLALHLGHQAEHCLVAAPFILFVSIARSSSSHLDPLSTGKRIYWLNRQFFFMLKTELALLLPFLLSVDLSRPLYIVLPNLADLFQILFFVIFALFGLRWSFQDQQQRCKHCLRSLATPARVGRPSHNLLEWNGTEQSCKHGHGLLSVPEMETSWRQSSQWIDHIPGWDRAAGI